MKNATPHNIAIFSRSQVREDVTRRKLVLLPGSTPVVTIPPSGIVLSSCITREELAPVDGIPVCRMVHTPAGVDAIPTDWVGGGVIVSALYAVAYREIGGPVEGPLYTVSQVVTDETGRPVGCLGLVRQ